MEEGFIGGGRWKYHAHASDLYPDTEVVNPLSDTEEDRDSIEDEAVVLSKDVAAGLLRKDILTRIQSILQSLLAVHKEMDEEHVWEELYIPGSVREGDLRQRRGKAEAGSC